MLMVTHTCLLSAQKASEYYLPLQTGNYLQYYTDGNIIDWSARTTKEYIDGTDTLSGEIYFRQIGTETDQYGTSTFHVFWLRYDAEGNVMIGAFSDEDAQKDSAMIISPPGPFFYKEYLTPGFVSITSWGKDSVMSNTENVSTQAGSFSNCIRIEETSYDNEGNIHVVDERYYAKNVGQVKVVRTYPASQVHTDLLTEYQAVLSAGLKGKGIPKSYTLKQNYPNPFNPATVINYVLSTNSVTTLLVYDIVGRVVTTLVNAQHQEPGTYTVRWDAAVFPSGVYFYQLQTNDTREMKKMILIQ